MKAVSTFLFGLWLAAGAAYAAAPAAAPKPFQFVLQNGLQVVVVPDARAPVVSQMLWYKTGAADDPPGLSGMAHFFEHMMFRGTRAFPGDGFSRAVTRSGGEDNAFTTQDATVFFERIGRDKLRFVMHLEADRMRNLNLSDDAVATERSVVLSERRERVDGDPEAMAEEQARAALHLSHPYGRPVIGWADEIRRIGRVEAADYYRRHFAPNNAILVVAGDVSPAEVRSMAEAEYGPLPTHEMVAHTDYAQPPRLGETRLTLPLKSARVPEFLRLYRVQSYAEAAPGRAEALAVLAELLGGDSASALYRKLVLEHRLATDVTVSYDGYARDAGEFSIIARPRPGVPLEALEHAIDETIARFQHHPPAHADLKRAERQLAADAVFRRDNPFDTASAYGRALAIGLTLQDVTGWPARIEAVSGEAVAKAAAASLVRKEAVTVYLTPAR